MKLFGRVGLAVTRFSSAGDGVAYVGRLLRHALEPVSDELVCVELGEYDGHPISLPRKGAYIAQLARAQRVHQPDWWLFAHCDLARLHFGLPPRLRRPYAVFLHGMEMRDGTMNRARCRALEIADARLANSRYTARLAVNTCPESGVVSICPLALLPDPPAGATDMELLRSVGGGYALIVARMNAAERFKGHDALLDAWPAIRGAVPGARLVVVGGGDDVDRLRHRAAALRLGAAVRFTGHVSDATLAALRAHAAFFVMPSANEGFGLVYLEAMRAGLACIGGDADAAAEIIVDGQTGLLVRPDDTAALAAAVSRLFLEPELTRRMGDAGAARARRDYTLDRFQARIASALHLPFAYRRNRVPAAPAHGMVR
ncbi:MAG TPA: glycosyltransferase family 4 protein [Longimicrobiales bacterium]|nr:glycosyltransferase family 4 protein [Longimicrobiales bacterium]